jgi:hypothetical protein
MYVDGSVYNQQNNPNHVRTDLTNQTICVDIGKCSCSCKLGLLGCCGNNNTSSSDINNAGQGINTSGSDSCKVRVMEFAGTIFFNLSVACGVGSALAYKYDGRINADGNAALSPWLIPLAVASIACAVTGGVFIGLRGLCRKVTPVVLP